jgi:hypothetical protein
MEGVPAREVRHELNSNAAKREELKAKLAAADAPPPLLHPEMADLHRQKVIALGPGPGASRNPHGGLSGASWPHRRHRPDAEPGQTANRAEREIWRRCWEPPQNAKRSPDTGDLLVQIKLVAGARRRLYRPPSTPWPHDRHSAATSINASIKGYSTVTKTSMNPHVQVFW